LPGGCTAVTITSSHGERAPASDAVTRIAPFSAQLRQTAEQLTLLERVGTESAAATEKVLRRRKLMPPWIFPSVVAASYG
jgi:hypothetical protein